MLEEPFTLKLERRPHDVRLHALKALRSRQRLVIIIQCGPGPHERSPFALADDRYAVFVMVFAHELADRQVETFRQPHRGRNRRNRYSSFDLRNKTLGQVGRRRQLLERHLPLLSHKAYACANPLTGRVWLAGAAGRTAVLLASIFHLTRRDVVMAGKYFVRNRPRVQTSEYAQVCKIPA